MKIINYNIIRNVDGSYTEEITYSSEEEIKIQILEYNINGKPTKSLLYKDYEKNILLMETNTQYLNNGYITHKYYRPIESDFPAIYSINNQNNLAIHKYYYLDKNFTTLAMESLYFYKNSEETREVTFYVNSKNKYNTLFSIYNKNELIYSKKYNIPNSIAKLLFKLWIL